MKKISVVLILVLGLVFNASPGFCVSSHCASLQAKKAHACCLEKTKNDTGARVSNKCCNDNARNMVASGLVSEGKSVLTALTAPASIFASLVTHTTTPSIDGSPPWVAKSPLSPVLRI